MLTSPSNLTDRELQIAENLVRVLKWCVLSYHEHFENLSLPDRLILIQKINNFTIAHLQLTREHEYLEYLNNLALDGQQALRSYNLYKAAPDSATRAKIVADHHSKGIHTDEVHTVAIGKIITNHMQLLTGTELRDPFECSHDLIIADLRGLFGEFFES
jgi:hypothetical protein